MNSNETAKDVSGTYMEFKGTAHPYNKMMLYDEFSFGSLSFETLIALFRRTWQEK